MKTNTTTARALAAAGLFGGLSMLAGQASAHVSYGAALYNDTGANPANLSSATLGSECHGSVCAQTSTAANAGFYGGSSAGLAQASTDWNNYRIAHGGIPAGATTAINAGNSHDSKFFYIALSHASQVTFAVAANPAANGVVAHSDGSSVPITGSFQPAFSIFGTSNPGGAGISGTGLLPRSAHDGASGNAGSNANLATLDPNGFAPWSQFYQSNNPAYDTTGAGLGGQANGSLASAWGNFRSDANWAMGRDNTPANYPNGTPVPSGDFFNAVHLVGYATNAGQVAGGTLNANDTTHVAATFALQPGVYSVVVGGNDGSFLDAYMAAQFASIGLTPGPDTQCQPTAGKPACAGRTDAIADYRGKYGFNISTTVAPVPIPAAVWLFGSALAGLLGFGRRKAAAQA